MWYYIITGKGKTRNPKTERMIYMTIKNLRNSCGSTRTLSNVSDSCLASVFVEVIINTETGELRTMQHSDAYSRAALDDDEISVNTYCRPATMKDIREDTEAAVREHERFRELYC